jgi:DNA-3-methyladenine glycosylase I
VRAANVAGMPEKKRCFWCTSDPLYVAYHDEEWGIPIHDDRQLFEMLILEGAQAGLSWLTILRRREGYRRAFDRFDARKIARYDRRRAQALMQDPGIIRNRLKIEATISNAAAFLEAQKEPGGFSALLWNFVGGETQVRKPGARPRVTSPEAEAMSRDLKRRGFRFVGPTICYAFMQAVGMVNDHAADCFRRRELAKKLR